MNEDTNKLLNVISKISERMDELRPGKGVGYYAVLYKDAIKLRGDRKAILSLQCCYCGKINIFGLDNMLVFNIVTTTSTRTYHFECCSCKKMHYIYAKDDIFYVVAADKP